MTDIQYWEDTLTEEIEAISEIVEKIPNMDTAMEKSEALERCKSRLHSAAGTKRSFKMEIRIVQEIRARRNFEGRLQLLDQHLQSAQADIMALESKLAREEIMNNVGVSFNNENNEDDAVKTGDNMLAGAAEFQNQTQDSLSNAKQLVAEAKTIGVSTLEELQSQRKKVQNIDRRADLVDSNLIRAEALLKQFARKIAGDSMIRCFAAINVFLMVAVIIWALAKNGGYDNEELPPGPARMRG